MKLLTIGIDGGDKNIFKTFDMPFLRGLLKQNEYITITEDLWSRGWASIVTGLPGTEHGGFYEKPLLDGTYRFTQRFGTKNIEANTSIVPLWNLLAKTGHSIGMMNVPGTAPAPGVSGFMVSGAGGGLGKVDGIPDALCYPKDIKGELENTGYISDVRFLSSGIRNTAALFERLILMQEKRTQAFLKLIQKYNVDFGFVAYMATSRIQNLAMSEINALADGRARTAFSELLLTLYRSLDQCISKLVDTVKPNQLMIVADHGAAPYHYSLNLDDFLVEAKFLKKRGKISAAGMLKKIVPTQLKKSLITSMPKKASQFSGNLNMSQAYAFGHRYVPGMYINDKKRFNGVVDTTRESEQLVREICDTFNDNSLAKERNMYAKPYRSEHTQSEYYDLLPDIWIDKPDDIFVEGQGGFFEKNAKYGDITNLNEVTGDIYTGIKGRNPFFLVDNKTYEYLRDNDKRDLTLAYKLIKRSFEE